VPPENQVMQKNLSEEFGAKVKYVLDSEAGHDVNDERVAELISWIYGNIPGSGVNVEDELLPPDDDWGKHGTFAAFD